MIYLKNVCLLLVFSFIFINHAAAQQKPPTKTPSQVVEAGDTVNPQTKKFESKAGKFSINISQEPFDTQSINAGTETIRQFLWRFEKTLFTVAYSEFPKNELIQAFADMNSGMRKGIINSGSKLVSEKEISFGKYSGKEFVYTAPNGVNYIGRNYLVNTTGYQIVGGFIDEEGKKEVLKVLDSFQIFDKKN